MSETLEPRQVGKPFLGRWVRSTFALLAGSPWIFGAAVVLLAVLDLFYIDVTPVRLIDAGLTLVVGALLLPAFWIAMSLVSRRTDRTRDRSEQLEIVMPERVWGGGLLSGCVLAAVNWLFHWALSASPAYADIIGSYAVNSLLLVASLGVCYFPLMALAPGLTMVEAWHLSRKASGLNSGWVIVTFVTVLSLVPDAFAHAVPAGVIVTAAVLVFIGVFNYVAYLDIFERRLDYVAQPVFAPRSRKVPALRRPGSPRPPERPRPPPPGPWVDRSRSHGLAPKPNPM
ncbi:MAG TPA: hypothetical protein VGG63_19190 [Steroidobacteraceae bacterium]|jgi:hypothetical protein